MHLNWVALSVITSTFTGPRRTSCKQKKPRGPRLRVQRIVITRIGILWPIVTWFPPAILTISIHRAVGDASKGEFQCDLCRHEVRTMFHPLKLNSWFWSIQDQFDRKWWLRFQSCWSLPSVPARQLKEQIPVGVLSVPLAM